jgi:hypothetical protein
LHHSGHIAFQKNTKKASSSLALVKIANELSTLKMMQTTLSVAVATLKMIQIIDIIGLQYELLIIYKSVADPEILKRGGGPLENSNNFRYIESEILSFINFGQKKKRGGGG